MSHDRVALLREVDAVRKVLTVAWHQLCQIQNRHPHFSRHTTRDAVVLRDRVLVLRRADQRIFRRPRRKRRRVGECSQHRTDAVNPRQGDQHPQVPLPVGRRITVKHGPDRHLAECARGVGTVHPLLRERDHVRRRRCGRHPPERRLRENETELDHQDARHGTVFEERRLLQGPAGC